MLETLAIAFADWQGAVNQLSWHRGIMVLAYFGAAWLCLLNGHISRQNRQAHLFWYVGATALCLLAVNSVLQVDVFITHLLRAFAKLQGWYGQRRALQFAAVLLLGLIAFIASGRLGRRLSADGLPSHPVAWGLSAALLLFALRAVSSHWTDYVLNSHVAGVSIGRLFELAAIGSVIHGARQCLRLH